MHCPNQWVGWLAALGVVVAGCDRGEQASAPPVAAQSTERGAPGGGATLPTTSPAAPAPAGGEKDAAPAKAPPRAAASLQEAARVIDLRTFPALPHDEMFHRTAVKIGYRLANPDLAEAVAFYRGKLTEAGWKLDAEEVNAEKQFGVLGFSKQGFLLRVAIVEDPNTGRLQVFVENQGNVDARSLPRFGGAELSRSQPDVSAHLADGKIDAVTEFVRTELKKLGWREVVAYEGMSASEPGVSEYLMFIQRGIHIDAQIHAKQDKSEVGYQVRMLKVELPIMAEVTGRIEHMQEPFVHLLYVTKSPAESVLEFYRRELPGCGWSVQDKVEKGKAGALKVKLESPDHEPLRLEILGQEQVTFVSIGNAPSSD